jgi:hypothetical protein
MGMLIAGASVIALSLECVGAAFVFFSIAGLMIRFA